MSDDHMDDVLKGLEAALAVEPSPEFAARVRARVSKESARRRAWPAWAAVGLATAAVVVLTVAAWPRRSPIAAQVTATRTPEPAASSSRMSPIAAPAPAPDRQIVKAATSRIARALRQHPAPEVLVPPGQAEALRTLLAGLSDGTIDPGSLATPPPDAAAALAPAPEIVIPPIVIPSMDARTAGTPGGDGSTGIRD
ncbi:MAG TPA: hypothetical protein VLT86_03980 [Vicinamibacterales bacterium]|nr:hypothetical protein [Vicinamibacterales bacterium]